MPTQIITPENALVINGTAWRRFATLTLTAGTYALTARISVIRGAGVGFRLVDAADGTVLASETRAGTTVGFVDHPLTAYAPTATRSVGFEIQGLDGTPPAGATWASLTLVSDDVSLPPPGPPVARPAEIPLVVPATIRAGTSVSWFRAGDSETWSLRYVLTNATTRVELTTTPAVGGWLTELSIAQTTPLVPGEYEWRSFRESGAAREPFESGRLRILPNLLAGVPVDERSRARRGLDAIEAVLEGRASRDQEEMSFNGRSLKRMSIEALFKLRDHYKYLVRREEAAERGESPSDNIRVRFGR